ncbi:MAG: hypothetical protein RLZZ174_551 [Pseudomonadota bacterium]
MHLEGFPRHTRISFSFALGGTVAMPVTRRHLLRSSAASLTLPLLGACAAPLAPRASKTGRKVFLHGVASGDPGQRSIVLWTRATPQSPVATLSVAWTFYADPQGTRPLRRGELSTHGERDWTAKVLVDGLEPGRTYYYQFTCQGEASPLGRTRTLPGPGVQHLRIAYTSCSHWLFGYFNAYGAMAKRDDLDLVLHLGDYIYEYGNGEYGDGEALGRRHQPDREIVSLADYRTRYALYRTDDDLQELHRQHPIVVIWDDHETANNSWKGGAQNHGPDEGSWPARKASAVRAWHEWLPTREAQSPGDAQIWRTFRFGNLLDLTMLDTRLYGRDQEAASPKDQAVIQDPTRSLLGPAQEHWLFDGLRRSKADGVSWRILGQQVMFGQLGGYGDTPILNTDQWDGYPHARNRLLDVLEGGKIDNVAVLTGDIHSSWAMDIARAPFGDAYNPDTGRGSLAVEFVTPSVTSPFLTDRKAAEARAAQGLEAHPHMRFIDLFHKGYVLLDITPERLQGEFWHLATITEKRLEERLAAAYLTARGENRLQRASGPSAAGQERAPAA